MKLRKITVVLFAMLFVLSSCKKDDDGGFQAVPDRPRGEVYEEDIAEIEEFLQTHFYNYEDFDFTNPYSPANDSFQIVFDTIAGDNSDKTPLIDMVDFKIFPDSGVDYKLYFLRVREGIGNVIHASDQASLSYEGTTTTGFIFDSTINPVQLNLLTVGSQLGVVPGFQQGIIEFKTSTGYTENGDGTVTFNNHGIGTIFVPSGLGYFSQPVVGVDSYTPLIFKVNLFERTLLDHDLDKIKSYMEDLDGDGEVYNDDTDGDFLPNFIDNDDDNDGYLSRDELDYNEYIVDTNMGETEPVLAVNEFEYDRNDVSGVITIKTFVITDSNNDGTPDYLDINTIPE